MRDESFLPGYNFIVYMGSLQMNFAKISGIDNEIEVETLVEGGVNDEVHILHKNRSQGGRLIFENGVGNLKRPLDALFKASLLGAYLRLPGTILVLSADKKKAADANAVAEKVVAKVYGYNGALPVKWSLQDLDAQTGQILIERIELIHQGIFDLSI